VLGRKTVNNYEKNLWVALERWHPSLDWPDDKTGNREKTDQYPHGGGLTRAHQAPHAFEGAADRALPERSAIVSRWGKKPQGEASCKHSKRGESQPCNDFIT